jgi:hypothetical protein
MAEHYVATYLNDHLAGSEIALELLDLVDQTHDPARRFASELRAEIAADRRELEAVMARLKVAVSRSRKAAAWLSEKIMELKLRLDDRKGGALHQLEIWEALSLGIEGKRLLWRSLAAATESTPGHEGTDYGLLQRRADEQRQGVENVRLEAAKAALGFAAVDAD